MITSEKYKVMDWKKISLLSGMAIVAWLLMIEWTQFDVSSQALGVKPRANEEIPNIIEGEGQSCLLYTSDAADE